MFRAAERKYTKEESDGFLQVENHGISQYPYRLNFYDKPPLYDVTIEDFETSALDRLRILAEIESSAARNRTWDEAKDVTLTQCAKYLPLNSNSASNLDLNLQRKRDHLGHFVLRLAFCRSEDLRRRFVKAESTLFKVRYESDDSTERRQFLNTRDFDWIPVDTTEKEKFKKELSSYLQVKYEAERDAAFKNETFYKVKWTRVPDLVEKRRVFLKRGWAYVPGREQSSIIYREFEDLLEKALDLTAKALPRLEEDTRLVPILENLSRGFLAGVPSDWGVGSSETSGEGITADMVDSLAKQHFPLCMRMLHQNLRKDHHLKHFGRLHYGLFLKVLGLSIEEAITFWRKSFMGGKAANSFDKEHKYNIRHSYGLEGRRANYPAKNCLQLHGVSEAGCPYRALKESPENLQSALLSLYSSQGLATSDLPEIMHHVKTERFHVACTRVFEITHSRQVKKGEGLGDGESVTHPNQYAARSMELEKAVHENTKLIETNQMEVD